MGLLNTIQSMTSAVPALSNLFEGASKAIDTVKNTFQSKTASKDALKTVEARKQANPNQPLPGKESDPAVKVLLDAVDTVKGVVSKILEPRFDAKDLYGPSGNPVGTDIQQDRLGDCYYVSTLAAVADQQPQRIKDAIQYNEKNGNFTVTLNEKYDSNGWKFGGEKERQVKVTVTQGDLLRNLNKQGGSTVDNNPGTDGPIWPAVMETAFAKHENSNWDKDWSPTNDKGFDPIANGGWPKDAMFSVTGQEGEVFKAGSGEQKLNEAYDKIDKALSNGQPITLWTKKENQGLWTTLFGTTAQDGLQDNHAYELTRIRRDANNDILVQVRNPWSHNLNVREGNDTASALIEVKLKTLVDTNGLGGINIGPEMQK